MGGDGGGADARGAELPVPGAKDAREGAVVSRWVIIPDTQVRAGVDTDHLGAAGRYIRDKRPDVVVHLGDHWDMPSLSSYERRGSHYFEGARYSDDVESGNAAMRELTAPWGRLRSYQPDAYLLRGNHEDRISRALNADPRLIGTIGLDDLRSPGWKVVPFLRVLKLSGIWISHYFQSPQSSRPLGGTARRLLDQVGNAYIQGHRQGLDTAIKQRADGSRQRGLIAGSFYQHDEEYRGPQGTAEWRGIVVLNEVRAGSWDQLEISTEWLLNNYGE